MDGDSIRVGISSCLLGNEVRYDGGHKLDELLRDAFGALVTWIPVCPEVECGLPVPREALHLVGDPANPRLVTMRTGVDHTAGMRTWAARRLDALGRENLCGFIFKTRSPSCGLRHVAVCGQQAGVPFAPGVGLFAAAFVQRFPRLPVEDELRLADPGVRQRFLGRLIAAARTRA
jgi:uncharacterized protein YbbK (DUF523 family)